MGYLNGAEKTREAFGEDDWLRTGDIAKIDADGYLYITGRLKELIITAGGENVAPVPIEDRIKAELPRIVSNCMLVGDKQKFLVVLVTLKVSFSLGRPVNLSCDCFFSIAITDGWCIIARAKAEFRYF